MTPAAMYAKAMYSLVGGKSDVSKPYLAHLRTVLARRGHQKLLPAIFTEYEKLELAAQRSKSRATITPESERTRILLELYRRLVSTN